MVKRSLRKCRLQR